MTKKETDSIAKQLAHIRPKPADSLATEASINMWKQSVLAVAIGISDTNKEAFDREQFMGNCGYPFKKAAITTKGKKANK